MTKFFFHPSLLLLFLDPGSEIRDQGWVKIRIRDKHPGSATLDAKKGFAVARELLLFFSSRRAEFLIFFDKD